MITIAKSVVAAALIAISCAAWTQGTIPIEPAHNVVQPVYARPVQPYTPPTATLDTSSGQRTALNGDTYLTINECNNLHCDAAPGMIGVIDSFEGVAPQYARHWLTLVVGNMDTRQVLETRHVGVLANGKFMGDVRGYDKPSGRYMFGVYTSDQLDHLVASGSFTVTKTKASDPLAPVAQDVVGAWYGFSGGSTGSITLNADGTYTKDGQYGGHYVASNGHVHFDGVLSVWDNGNAVTTAAHALVFHWTENGYGVEMSYSR
ncbi:MAG TPA: hypothetical protein VF022_11935 [Rhodanobacteraceae bacterium]|jgi:hypothetical protein